MFMRLSDPQIQLLVRDLLAEARSQLIASPGAFPTPAASVARGIDESRPMSAQDTIQAMRILADDPEISFQDFRSEMTSRGVTTGVLELKQYRFNIARLLIVPRWLHEFILERAAMMPDRIGALKELVELEMKVKSPGNIYCNIHTLENWYRYCIVPLIAKSDPSAAAPCVLRSWGQKQLMRLSTSQASLLITDRLKNAMAAAAGAVASQMRSTTTHHPEGPSRSVIAHVSSKEGKKRRVPKRLVSGGSDMSGTEDPDCLPSSHKKAAVNVVNTPVPQVPDSLQPPYESGSVYHLDVSREADDPFRGAPSRGSSDFDDWVPQPLVADEDLFGDFLDDDTLVTAP